MVQILLNLLIQASHVYSYIATAYSPTCCPDSKLIFLRKNNNATNGSLFNMNSNNGLYIYNSSGNGCSSWMKYTGDMNFEDDRYLYNINGQSNITFDSYNGPCFKYCNNFGNMCSRGRCSNQSCTSFKKVDDMGYSNDFLSYLDNINTNNGNYYNRNNMNYRYNENNRNNRNNNSRNNRNNNNSRNDRKRSFFNNISLKKFSLKDMIQSILNKFNNKRINQNIKFNNFKSQLKELGLFMKKRNMSDEELEQMYENEQINIGTQNSTRFNSRNSFTSLIKKLFDFFSRRNKRSNKFFHNRNRRSNTNEQDIYEENEYDSNTINEFFRYLENNSNEKYNKENYNYTEEGVRDEYNGNIEEEYQSDNKKKYNRDYYSGYNEKNILIKNQTNINQTDGAIMKCLMAHKVFSNGNCTTYTGKGLYNFNPLLYHRGHPRSTYTKWRRNK